MFTAIGGVDDLCNSNRCQISISLVGEDDSILSGPFHSGGHGRGPSMRCFQDIDIEIFVHEDGATHRGNTDRLFPDLEIVDGLCHETVGNTVVASRTEMEGNIDQGIQDV